jgi:hypothetical protein
MLHQVNVANGFGRDYAQEAALALVGPQIEHYKKFGFWQDFEVAGWIFSAGEAGWILKGLLRTSRSLLTRSFDDLLPIAANRGGRVAKDVPITDPARMLMGGGKVADHHIIPAFRGKSKAYADFIKARGIDVDQFTVTLAHGKASHHLKFVHGQGKWNQRWMDWIDANPDATAKDIFQFAGKMMDEFGLSGLKIHPYGKP